MSSPFWLEDINLQALFSKLIAEDDSIASLWDIFSSYEMVQYPQAGDADTSEQWLAKQNIIIDDAISIHFSSLDLIEDTIADILDTIDVVYREAISQGEFVEVQGLDPKWFDTASAIVDKHLAGIELTQHTFDNFLDAFEKKLLADNKQHVLADQQIQLRESLESLTDLPEELKQTLLGNLDGSLMNELDGEPDLEGGGDEPFADWPRLSLACSTTFYSENDGGNIDYDEREHIVAKKFSDYKSQVNSLLSQLPAFDLAPLSLDDDKIDDEKALDMFYDLFDENVFFHVFESDFSVWQSEDKVLFLYVAKEDKELPYEIVLGGMLLADYRPILKRYNSVLMGLNS